MEKDKIIQSILTDLQSTEDITVLNALEVTRHKGNSKCIPAVIDLLNHSSNEITEAAKKILFDLKDKSAIDLMLDKYTTTSNKNVRNIILQSLWQSNINPVNQVSRLVKFAISGTLEECIEIYSIITNIIDEEIPSAEIMESLLVLQEKLETVKDKSQKQLLEDIRSFLQAQE